MTTILKPVNMLAFDTAEALTILRLDTIEETFGQSLLNLDLSQEELQTEALEMLDQIRRQKLACKDQLPALWKKLYQKFRQKDSSVATEELKFATSLVFDYVYILLQCCSDPFYQYEVGEAIFETDSDKNGVGVQDRIQILIDLAEPHEAKITEWIDSFFSGNQDMELPVSKLKEGTHPLAQYIIPPKKKGEILEWMHSAIKAQKEPKDKLAVLKAAMTTEPRIISNYVTIEVFNEEFDEKISPDSFKNWKNENRQCKYAEDDLKDYRLYLEGILKA